MSAGKKVKRGMVEVRRAILGHVRRDVGIELSPDHLDGDIDCLQLGQPRRIACKFVKEIRRQLYERGAGTGLPNEVIGDELLRHGIEVRPLTDWLSVTELVWLPGQQPFELFGTLRDGAAQGVEALRRKQLDHLGPLNGKRIVVS